MKLLMGLRFRPVILSSCCWGGPWITKRYAGRDPTDAFGENPSTVDSITGFRVCSAAR
jgi:hypothetical protein